MKIQVLGSGCPTCKNLHKAVEEVVKKLDQSIEVVYSTDISKIVELGVMNSPVLVIDGKLITAGKVPNKEEIEKAILDVQKNGSTESDQVEEGGCSCGGCC